MKRFDINKDNKITFDEFIENRSKKNFFFFFVLTYCQVVSNNIYNFRIKS